MDRGSGGICDPTIFSDNFARKSPARKMHDSSAKGKPAAWWRQKKTEIPPIKTCLTKARIELMIQDLKEKTLVTRWGGRFQDGTKVVRCCSDRETLRQIWLKTVVFAERGHGDREKGEDEGRNWDPDPGVKKKTSDNLTRRGILEWN